jgi:DNA-binding LacI/PurR family transcriptional regulator
MSWISEDISPMVRKRIITLEEVAARAGVSAGTVSRVLNGKNKENRPAIASRSEHIRRIALKLGYKPNTAARSMSHGRFLAVGFVTCGDTDDDWYPISGLNGIHLAIEELHWRLMFNELSASTIRNPKIVPQLFSESAVDGLIVNLLPVFSEAVEYFEKQSLPFVFLNLKRKTQCVYPDEASGTAAAVNYVISQGKRRIGFFSRRFPHSTHYSALDRYNGVQAALKNAKIDAQCHLEPLGQPGDAPMTVIERAEVFLERFPNLEAVVCYEQEEAACLTMAAERRGIRIPDKLQILGFCERDIHGNTGLPIETVPIPFHDVGKAAITLLRAMIESGDYHLPSVSVPYSSKIKKTF